MPFETDMITHFPDKSDSAFEKAQGAISRVRYIQVTVPLIRTAWLVFIYSLAQGYNVTIGSLRSPS
jgi:hypothetical protein